MSKVCAAPTGYKGQRYEVSYLTGSNQREVAGWTNAPDGGGLRKMILAHPVWKQPRVKDLKPQLRTPAPRASGDCMCTCGKKYYDHPADYSQLFNGSPFLNVLCDGSYVKL